MTSTATTVTLGELEFDVLVAGPSDGIPTVLLHGFPQTSACWDAVVPHLTAARLRTIAPDQRGYSPGARPDGVDAYASDELVGDVLGCSTRSTSRRRTSSATTGARPSRGSWRRSTRIVCAP